VSVLHAAVPLFLTLMILEWLAARLRGRRVYLLRDSVTDLGCGILSQIVGVFLALLSLGAYRFVAEHAAITHYASVPAWPAGGPLASWRAAAAWAGVFVLVDCGQYWMHRASHRVSILWACHLVHHSSEQLNYAVALRNSSLHGLFLWVVPLPLAFMGVPWEVFAICYGLNVAYQFWLHTRVIGRLGPLESVLNTPSHHRVHHGRDPEYLDRNFGGVFILWDRLFGTFAREVQEPDYGMTVRTPGSNPVWANLWGFAAIAREMRRATSMRGKVRALVGPPQWTEPADASPEGEAEAADDPLLAAYAISQFLAMLVATITLLDRLGRAPLWDVAAFGILAALTLAGVSAALDHRTWVLRFEAIRLLSIGAACLPPMLHQSVLLPPHLVLLYAGASLLILFVALARRPSFAVIGFRGASLAGRAPAGRLTERVSSGLSDRALRPHTRPGGSGNPLAG
jgi:sterol desaturase/sphingolipid hydroxylase (fatty acid hydroxylase superfamily)